MKLRMVFSGPWERERDQKIVFKSHILHLLGLWPPTCPQVGQHVGNFLSRGHLWCHHYCKGSSTWVLPSMLPPSLRRGEVEWLCFTGATSLPVLSLVLSMRQLAAHTCAPRPHAGGILLRSKVFLRGWRHHHSLEVFLPRSVSGKCAQSLYEGGVAWGNSVLFQFCLWQKILTLIH